MGSVSHALLRYASERDWRTLGGWARRGMRPLRRWYPAAVAVAVTSAVPLALGVFVVKAPTIAFAFAVLPGAIVMATRSPPYWIASALVAAVALRGIVGLEILPQSFQYLHIPLAWGALCIALIRGHRRTVLAHRSIIWLGFLGFAILASSLLNHSEALRGPVYFAVLAEPFAIVSALLIEPPTPSERTFLLRTCVVLIGVQVPLAYFQAVALGFGDSVQGTLYGSGAGHHAVAAIVVLGAFWYLGRTRRVLSPIPIVMFAAIAGVVMISDAKQVAFALPVAIIGSRLLSRSSVIIGLTAFILIYIIVHFQPLGSSYVVPYLQRSVSGDTGKIAAANMIWHEGTAELGTFIFGQGPAETVSRTAYQTVPANQRDGSPLRAFGLAPAETAIDAEEVAAAVVKAKGKSAYFEPFNLASADSGMSSGVGLFGDLGVIGFLTYAGLFMTIFVNIRRDDSAEALAAGSGFAMLIVLGFLHDWLELPAFTVLLATLAALAITRADATLPPRVASPIQPNRRHHDVEKVIARSLDKALRSGQFCTKRYDATYARYGFVCRRGRDGRYRLRRFKAGSMR